MSENFKGLVLAVILGLMCPLLLIRMISPAAQDQQQTLPTSTEQTEAIVNQVFVRLLKDDASVVQIPLEEYLVGVVLREMPVSFELEALKAQAVVARTYTLRRIGQAGKHVDADVCTNSSCCQGYYEKQAYFDAGGNSSGISKVEQAVKETTDMVLVYADELIDAVYFSCSGGMTEDAVAVWGAQVPYLQATESPGEENATHYIDTVTFTRSEFLKGLSLEVSPNAPIRVGQISYTQGGGVNTIEICGEIYSGTDVRKRLNLRSTAFVLSAVGDSVTVTTKGFGHRVGMSQYGADAMAVGGAGYEQILSHYYNGTKLVAYHSD